MSKSYTIEDYNNEFNKRNVSIVAIEEHTENGKRFIKCRCQECNNTFLRERRAMSNYCGCPVCRGFQIVKGINDIATTDPWAVPYFVNKDDVYRYSRKSTETAIIKCCNCGKENKLKIYNFFYNRNENKNKGCKYCSPKDCSFTFEELKNLYAQKYPELTVTNYNEDTELYTLHCNNCGENFTRTHSAMKSFHGCNICTSKMIVKGVNDIATTAPWIVPYVVDKEYCYTHTAKTTTKTLMKCTTCGYERMARVQQFSKREHYYCPMCDDGISYPNKYGREFLKQLPIDNLQAEYYDDWTNGKIFDNYFEYNGVSYIVEMDGAIHYRDGKYTTLEKCRANDRYKDQLCKDKGIELIRIDCEQSKPTYIKNSILNSRFTELFDLSKIDWDKCDCCASESAIKVVCDCYNEHPTMTQYEIADYLDIPYSRVGKYLHKGAKLGLCDYSSEKAIENKLRKSSDVFGYHVVAYDLKMNKIGEYSSITKAVKALKEIYPNKPIYHTGVIRVLNGEKDSLNGIIFQRVN